VGFVESAQRTIRMESGPPSPPSRRGSATGFERACELILPIDGRVVVTGMGKSGHVASKIAATLASTGTPAFFVHPARRATATWA
jgi:arabinose-5-phosphate isomerase